MPGAVRWLWLERQDCLVEVNTVSGGLDLGASRAYPDEPEKTAQAQQRPKPLEWREVIADLWGPAPRSLMPEPLQGAWSFCGSGQCGTRELWLSRGCLCDTCSRRSNSTSLSFHSYNLACLRLSLQVQLRYQWI